MEFQELVGDQRRHLINAQQLHESWRLVALEFAHSFKGSMRWHKVGGKQYLYRKYGDIWKAIGPRSPETEQIKADYMRQRNDVRRQLTSLTKRIEIFAPLNRAHGIGRMPTIAARILRRLDNAGLLGKSIVVAGTNCLYAYEALTGVIFDSELTTTEDIDLLHDARGRLSLSIDGINHAGVIGLLRQVDKSFTRRATFSAHNDDGYIVDLIGPMQKLSRHFKSSKATDDDLEAVEIEGLEWLVNAPKVETICVGQDGKTVRVVCLDPRAFALHKHWLASKVDRNPLKRARDGKQALAVAVVAAEYMNMSLTARELSALPKHLLAGARELVSSVKTA